MKNIPLTNCEINRNYEIKEINLKDNQIVSQLKNYGIEVGGRIKVLLYNYGRKTALIESCGVNYMLGKNICDEIEVDEI